MKREISLAELKKIQLEILGAVHSFCEQHQLVYFLSSGSLIGAVRHKGYIPWDDDIDLYMPRKDYERFNLIFNSCTRLYRVVSLRTDPNCTFAFAKVERKNTSIIEHVDHPINIGINIDIFPVDEVPDDENERKKYFRRIMIARNKVVLKDVSIDFKKRAMYKNLILFIGKVFLFHRTLSTLARDVDALIDKKNRNSKYVCNLVLGNGIDSVFNRSCILDKTMVEFEGKSYYTMIGYEEYLKRTYGDYMKLPPKEKQVPHHSFSAYIEY